jgi:hypothetical protein
MNDSHKFRRFAIKSLVNAMIGGILFYAGILLLRYTLSEQRRLWEPSQIILHKESTQKQYIEVYFTPKDEHKHFLDLCFAKQSKEEYEKFKTSTPPQMDWQITPGTYIVKNKLKSNEHWHWSSSNGACTNLGSFAGVANQKHQIRLKLQQVNLLPFDLNPHLNIKPDFRETIGRMTRFQLIAGFLQLLGLSIYIFIILKGIINLLKFLRS